MTLGQCSAEGNSEGNIKPLFEMWLRSVKSSSSFRSDFLKSDIKFLLMS